MPLWRWKPFLFVCWLGVGVLVSGIDYVTGPYILFPLLFLFPVGLAAWFNGLVAGLLFAVGLPAVRLYFEVLWPVPWPFEQKLANAIARALVLAIIAFLVHRVALHTAALAARVRVLEGLLPICSFCKKIRDTRNEWQPLERYISDRSPVEFTHGVCPDCIKKHYAEISAKPGAAP